MNSLVPFADVMVADSASAPSTTYDDAVLSELCSVVFSSLRRSDQRRKGMEYVRGLLSAHGRKSIRNIASVVGGPAAQQSLHHFVASSTWDWEPVRQALADYLVAVAPPQAWVVRPMIIPKEGDRTVGVDRRFIPSLGHVVNAQHVVGVWGVSDGISYPVNWRLHLPETWVDDAPRRVQAAIPEEAEAETLGACAVQACETVALDWQLSGRPMVLDAREGIPLRAVHRLQAAGVPMLVRVSGTLPVMTALPRPNGRAVPGLRAVREVVESAGRLRRPVVWEDGTTDLTAMFPVRLPYRWDPAAHDAQGAELRLLSIGTPGGAWPEETWLTNVTDARPAALLRLIRLAEQPERDFAATGDQVGIRDFSGRSFSGWHRHVTLASAAHAVAVLTRRMSYQWGPLDALRDPRPVWSGARSAAPCGSPRGVARAGSPAHGAAAASRVRAAR